MRLSILAVGMVALLSLMLHLTVVTMENRKEYSITGESTTKDINVKIVHRTGRTSSWIKQKSGRAGKIYDVTLANHTGYLVRSWVLQISIMQDCYINQFWNGEVEIHQNVGSSSEVVQRMNLAEVKQELLKVDYILDESDLLIPLKKGDYILYYPSKTVKETPIDVGKTATVGGIFYSIEKLNFTNYKMKYFVKRDWREGIGFYISMILWVIFVLMVIFYRVAILVYKRAEYENQLRQSGIFCLSEIYALVYIIDLIQGAVTPVGISEDLEADRPKELPAREQFLNLMREDAKEEYLELAMEFVDLQTLPLRFGERSSITFEYESKRFGWQRIQFIVMERSAEGGLEKVIFTVQEINQEKREKDEILHQVEAAKMESNAKSTFLANMSHEIRTPINTILGLDTMILRECEQSDVRRYAKDIKIAGNMLLALINTILDYSKLEAGKMEMIEAEYSLTQMIFEVESVVKNRIISKNLAFHVDVSENIPDRLYGDDVRLKQIIINLLTNALKYTEKGSIRLGVFGTILSPQTVHLLISVRDTGMGITKENQKKLFDRFSRFDEQKNRKVEGTGIGMSLVKGLLDMMHSELKLSSMYGKGSDFYFEIEQGICDPITVGKVDWSNPQLPNEEEYEVSFIAPEAKILVVDDNEMNLTVFKNLLKETMVQIQTARSGEEALSYVKDTVYDLIFMDHMMPKMDGIETFKRIRQDTEGANYQTPVIILTANAIQGAREEYMSVGFTDYLSKPIDDKKLEEQMQKYLAANRIQRVERKAMAGNRQDTQGMLPEIEGIDSSYAVEHVGSLDGFLYIMRQFVSVAEYDAKELQGYCDTLREHYDNQEALESYRIKVHAMKTSVALCGGLQVHGVAAQLEYAAKNGAVKQILETTGYFLDFWLQLHARIKDYIKRVEPETEVKEGNIQKNVLHSLLDQLMTSMENYDIKNSDSIMEELDKYKEDCFLQNYLDQLHLVVANLDAEGCKEICSKMKGV